MRPPNLRTRLPTDLILMIFASALCSTIFVADPILDESPYEPGEWGYHPADASTSMISPPSFSWRPINNITWEVECARDGSFSNIVYRAENLDFNVHTPDQVFESGSYYWRYRGMDSLGANTNWSTSRHFRISTEASSMPLPPKEELLSRIPTEHPRLFLRPEELSNLRALATDELKDIYDRLKNQCEDAIANPPNLREPPLYPEDIIRGSDEWKKTWWGNRMYVIRALNAAATLAFTRRIGGPENYGEEAKRILMACAEWDPKGSTGYLYNDEAGMPYNYFFSRTYTFVHDLLSVEEKAKCREVMRIRGREMYEHLYPTHFWKPYGSHRNRAWHYLGEIGIAFHNEIAEAADWTWFATNVFFATYPVWSDDDGGWHEGISYWWEYQERFTWFADVMRSALQINAFDKPYYSQVGYYAMYLMPPGTYGTGFGDLVGGRKPSNYVPLMTTFALQSGNPHWQWWVEEMGGPVNSSEYHAHGDYISYVHGSLPKIAAQSPDSLPGSRIFKGNGRAYLNSDLTDGLNNVQVAFKSSPLGTQSHGYEANNSFNIWAYGKHLLVRSGRRDQYGSDHHKNWMWSTRSTNNIRIDGQDQPKHSANAKGKISEFVTTPKIDIVTGSTEHFNRTIIFAKPELIIVYDRLYPGKEADYEYWLHAENEMIIGDQHTITIQNDNVYCDIDFVAPEGLTFSQTNQFDPNPRPRIQLRQWHLTATAKSKSKNLEFITVYRPRNSKPAKGYKTSLEKSHDVYNLKIEMNDLSLFASLPINPEEVCEVKFQRGEGSAVKVIVEKVDAD